MKTNKIAAFTAAMALIVPASAAAHISIHPNTVPAGAFATLEVRVPGEQEGAHVTKVDTLFPPGFVGVNYEPVPGWATKVIETKLATPITQSGETIDSEVSQIIWTWTGPLGQVDNGQFINFPLSLAIPQDATGKALEFKTIQTYSNGQIVHWIDATLSAEHPAPRINITTKGGVIQDIAGEEAGPTQGQTGTNQPAPVAQPPAVAKASSGASKGLAITALILGALGLLLGLGAVASSRRNTTAP